MQDARLLQLTHSLLDRGWTLRDEALVAPHETMALAANTPHPDLAGFREKMSRVAEATSAYVANSAEQAELHADLVSLVEALDDMLDN
jgi:hypothetical protein